MRPVPPPPDLGDIVDATIARWHQGEAPDAAVVLARHPELESRRTLVLDLIHEELCLRKEKGDTIVPSTFIERFPEYQKSVARMLEVEEYGAQHPELAGTLEESLWPRIGQQFLGFEVLEPLGRGALARVYLARELEMGSRAVVIKVSQQGRREAHLLGKLAHENIVAAHSVKHDAATGMTLICMPLLGTATGLALIDAAFVPPRRQPPETAAVIGQAARQYQPAGLVRPEAASEAFPFSRRTYAEGVAWLGQQLAGGLAAAHSAGIVHRDIKPSNVLLAWSGRPMLLDFNLSTDLDEQADRLGGTIAYMAPERIAALLAGTAHAESTRDPRSDIFSLGVLLYELLTGRLPVQPAGAEQNDERSLRLWLQSRSLPMEPPSRTSRQVDPPLEAILLKCLATEPARRYATAAELAEELSSYLSRGATARRWLVRRRREVLAGSVAAVGLLAAGATWWCNRPPEHEVQFQRAMACYEAGNYRQAIRALDRVLDEHPDSVPALFARGQSHFWAGDLAAAQRDYRAAALLDPQPLYYFAAGTCALATDQGMQDLNQALRLGYDPAAVKCNLGLCFAYRNRPQQAIRCFDEAIELNPHLQPAYLERAIVRYNAGQLDEALAADIDRAVELGPQTRRTLNYAAIFHAKLAASRPQSRQRALDTIEQLLASGVPLESLQKNAALVPLLTQARFSSSAAVHSLPPDGVRGVAPPAELGLPPPPRQLAKYLR
jgi:serine/threonine protein kinase/Tfp pilus assembly protein PilF